MTIFFLLDAVLLGFAISAGTFVWTWRWQDGVAQSAHPEHLRLFYRFWGYPILTLIMIVAILGSPLWLLLGLYGLIVAIVEAFEYPIQTFFTLMAAAVFLGSIAGVHWRRLRRREPGRGIVSSHALYRFFCCTMACVPGFWLVLLACDYWPLTSAQHLTILGSPFEVALLAKYLYIFGALRAFSVLTSYYAEQEESPWDTQIQRATPANFVLGLFTYSDWRT
jgi:hypothetical protein